MSFQDSSKAKDCKINLDRDLADNSLCLGVDASTLSLPAGLVDQYNTNTYHDSQLDRYWTLGGLTPGKLSKPLTLKDECDETGDWVLCPGKDDVPDADYAPHLRRRRPGASQKPNGTTSGLTENETNSEPPVVVYAELMLAIGLGILSCAFN
ncbi:hypothetical protein RRG08_027928 [Elysia crispata]|uniref:Uncharacterized protein n=1 Tax=Elysia crispata TaxID=231223 RepID=A0AAE0Y8H9_9GAST|nr:hypothetical protein RRG08_027928 [Elysia crispata]